MIEAGLMRAIVADPTNDQPRLAYADALDARSHEGRSTAARAEFIRVQCELARRFPGPRCQQRIDLTPTHRCIACGALWMRQPNNPTWCLCSINSEECCSNAILRERVCPLEPLESNDRDRFQRAMNLFVGYYADWLRPMSAQSLDGTCARVAFAFPTHASTVAEVRFRRGFIDHVECPARVFTAMAGPLFAAHPIESVSLSDVQPKGGGEGGVMLGTLVGVPETASFGRGTMRIPLSIFDCLDGYAHATVGTTGIMYPTRQYRTPTEATQALERACVTFGRACGNRHLSATLLLSTT